MPRSEIQSNTRRDRRAARPAVHVPGGSVLKKPPQTFVPNLWANDIYKTLAHTIAESLAPSNDSWKVWFAWFPAKIIIYNLEVIHDEIVINGYTRWRWLAHVTRRPIRKYKFWRWPSRSYEYGPITNALTQPKVSVGRRLF